MSAASRPRILVVDDDPQILQLICIVLQRGEQECVSADGGAKALQKLKDGNYDYDAVILDLTMPTVNGFEVIRDIERTSPSLLRRLIVLTAMSDTASARLDRSTVFAVLAKPFDVQALAETVGKCLASSRAV